MSGPPERPFRSDEPRPPQPDPYAPVDYPSDARLPPPVYPPPPGYPPPQGYPSAGYSYDPYRPMRPHSTNGWAIASLVVALVSLLFCGATSIISLIIGIIAMRDTKRSGQDGYGVALAGVIISAVPIVLWLLYWLFFVVLFASSSQWAP